MKLTEVVNIYSSITVQFFLTKGLNHIRIDVGKLTPKGKYFVKTYVEGSKIHLSQDWDEDLIKDKSIIRDFILYYSDGKN